MLGKFFGLIVFLGFFSSAHAGQGDISIINSDGYMTFEVSHNPDFSAAQRVSILECRFRNPFANIGGTCDGVNGFNSNADGALWVKFYSQSRQNLFHQYKLTSGRCYKFVWHPLGVGFDLEEGCLNN